MKARRRAGRLPDIFNEARDEMLSEIAVTTTENRGVPDYLPATLENRLHDQAIPNGRSIAAVLRYRRNGEGIDPRPDQDPIGATPDRRRGRGIQHRLPAGRGRHHPRRIEAHKHFRIYAILTTRLN